MREGISTRNPEAVKAEQLAKAASFALSSLHRKENQSRPDGTMKRDIILVVDDSETARLAMRLRIEKTMDGFEAEEAESASDAIEKISGGLHDRVALIITDLIMTEGESGLDLSRALREDGFDKRVDVSKTQNIPTIIFSGSASSSTQPTPEVQEALDKEKLEGFVKKPIIDMGIGFYKAIVEAVVRGKKLPKVAQITQ